MLVTRRSENQQIFCYLFIGVLVTILTVGFLYMRLQRNDITATRHNLGTDYVYEHSNYITSQPHTDAMTCHITQTQQQNLLHLKSRLQNHDITSFDLQNVSKMYGFNSIIVIGDLHGDLQQTQTILQKLQIINQQNELICNTTNVNGHHYLNTIIMQTGDMVDRGPETIHLLEFWQDLKQKALNNLGKSILADYNNININNNNNCQCLILNILGNHEFMNLEGSFDYINKNEIKLYFDNNLTKYKEYFDIKHKIGEYLRKLPISMIIDNSLFVHAGMRPKIAHKYHGNITLINEMIYDWIYNIAYYYSMKKYDIAGQIWNRLMGKRKRTDDDENNIIVKDIIDSNGIIWTREFEPRIFGSIEILIHDLEKKFKMEKDTFVKIKNNNEKKDLIIKFMCQELNQTLKIMNVKRMIIGHNPQYDNNVTVYCDSKLFLIDVGLSEAYGKYFAAIHINLQKDSVEIID